MLVEFISTMAVKIDFDKNVAMFLELFKEEVGSPTHINRFFWDQMSFDLKFYVDVRFSHKFRAILP